jgi:hypothetical protein
MEIELFTKTYLPSIMKIVKQFSEKMELEIRTELTNDNHHVILKAKHKIDSLAEAKMLLNAYEKL